MEYYRAFPFYMGYQGYGQWAQPYFMSEDRILEDLEYLQQMYPTYAKKYQSVISSIVDKVDYEGSFIYDQYPDKLSIQRMVDSVMAVIKTNEEQESARKRMNAVRNEGAPENMPNAGMMSPQNMPNAGMMNFPNVPNEGMMNFPNVPNESMMNFPNMPSEGMGNPQNMPDGNIMPESMLNLQNMPENVPNGSMTPNLREQNVINGSAANTAYTEYAPWSEKEPWIRELVTVLMYYEILARRKKKNTVSQGRFFREEF